MVVSIKVSQQNYTTITVDLTHFGFFLTMSFLSFNLSLSLEDFIHSL